MTAFLQSLDPKLVYLMISGIAGGIIYLWRKFSIESWDAVTRHNEILQTLPALILSGLMSAAPAVGKGLWTVIGNIIVGAIVGGSTAIVGHQVLKASPLPYNGGQPLPPPLFPGPGELGATPTSELVTPPSRPLPRRP